MTYEWVKIGAEVVELARYASELAQYGRTRKITKVHKSGRFVLDDSPQQYSAWDDGKAVATGNGWSRSIVKLVTDEIRADIAADQRHVANVRYVEEQFKAIDRKNREQVAAIATALRNIEP